VLGADRCAFLPLGSAVADQSGELSEILVFQPQAINTRLCSDPPSLLRAVTQRNDSDISAGLDLTGILVKFGFIGMHDHFPIAY